MTTPGDLSQMIPLNCKDLNPTWYFSSISEHEMLKNQYFTIIYIYNLMYLFVFYEGRKEWGVRRMKFWTLPIAEAIFSQKLHKNLALCVPYMQVNLQLDAQLVLLNHQQLPKHYTHKLLVAKRVSWNLMLLKGQLPTSTWNCIQRLCYLFCISALYNVRVHALHK